MEGAIFPSFGLTECTLKEQQVFLRALLNLFTTRLTDFKRSIIFVLSILPDQCPGDCHLVDLRFTLLLECQDASGGEEGDEAGG